MNSTKIMTACLFICFVFSSCFGKPSISNSESSSDQYDPNDPNNKINLLEYRKWSEQILFIGVPIEKMIPDTNGVTPTKCSIKPNLPPGLVLNPDCSISGTPTQASPKTTYHVSVGATKYGAGDDITLSVAAKTNITSINYNYPSGQDHFVFAYTDNNLYYPAVVVPSGSVPLLCTVSPPLPNGLSLNSSCGVYGQPWVSDELGSNPYTVTVGNNETPNVSTQFVIEVSHDSGYKAVPQNVMNTYFNNSVWATQDNQGFVKTLGLKINTSAYTTCYVSFANRPRSPVRFQMSVDEKTIQITAGEVDHLNLHDFLNFESATLNLSTGVLTEADRTTYTMAGATTNVGRCGF